MNPTSTSIREHDRRGKRYMIWVALWRKGHRNEPQRILIGYLEKGGVTRNQVD